MILTGWCPSCTCGWHKALDAFDVTPPEADCRNVSCDCHTSYWQSVSYDQLKALDAYDQLPELEKRRLYGDR